MRDANGTFARGNPGGPGRPRRETEAAYLRTLRDAVPLDDWRAICERAATDAMAGDAKSREWLAKYLMPADLTTPPEDPQVQFTESDLEQVFEQADRRAAIEQATRREATV